MSSVKRKLSSEFEFENIDWLKVVRATTVVKSIMQALSYET